MIRKTRRSKKEVRELTKQALTLIDSGLTTEEALHRVNLTGAVFYRNREKIRPRKSFSKTIETISIQPNPIKSETELLKELVKDFLYERFLQNGGIK
jgi:hypothetical protein